MVSLDMLYHLAMGIMFRGSWIPNKQYIEYSINYSWFYYMINNMELVDNSELILWPVMWNDLPCETYPNSVGEKVFHSGLWVDLISFFKMSVVGFGGSDTDWVSTMLTDLKGSFIKLKMVFYLYGDLWKLGYASIFIY